MSPPEVESAKLDLPIFAVDRRLLPGTPPALALVRPVDVADFIISSLRFRAAATSGDSFTDTAGAGDGVTLMATVASVDPGLLRALLLRLPRLAAGKVRSTSGADSGAT